MFMYDWTTEINLASLMANCGKCSIRKHQTYTFPNSSWDVDPRNIGFDTIMELIELMELMEFIEFHP